MRPPAGVAAAAVGAGFADPEAAAQAHFRALLDAMAAPGRAVALGPDRPEPPAGLGPGAYALLLALADLEAPVWLDPGCDGEGARASLRFHCGCPIAERPDEAAFAVLPAAGAALPLARFRPGTPEYPDRAATLLVAVPSLEGGEGGARLRGPGIPEARTVRPEAVPAGFWAALREQRGGFPLGVDAVLLDPGGRVMALPRSVLAEPL